MKSTKCVDCDERIYLIELEIKDKTYTVSYFFTSRN